MIGDEDGDGARPFDRLWADARNWKGLGLYRAPDDPRLIVPKRIRALGWTVNAAHPAAWLVLALMVIVSAGLPISLIELGVTRPGPLLAVVGLCLGATALLCHWEASRRRPTTKPTAGR
jgi:hypothetical protein